MKYNKDNVIYIDFIFKRKRINSKSLLLLYRLYSKLLRIFPFRINRNKNKKQASYNSRKTSKY